MNTDLTPEFVKTVLGTFSFGKRLLTWDSVECHMESSVIKSLEKVKIDHVIIPGGCTKFIQAPDVSWNKTFKAFCTERYNQWSADGVHAETKDGNLLKEPPRKRIVEWILDAWASLSKDLIAESFKCCALNLPVDESEDDLIQCFKEEEPCAAGKDLLEVQMEVFRDMESSDIVDAMNVDFNSYRTRMMKTMTKLA